MLRNHLALRRSVGGGWTLVSPHGAHHDSPDIGVRHHGALTEGEGCNGRGRVLTDSWQSPKFFFV